MYLTRRNQNWLPEVFNTLFDTDLFPKMNMTTTTSPAINVIEKDNEYDVELAAPGMTRDDFKVTLDEEQNLVVDLEKKVETADGDDASKADSGRYLRREFSYTKFHQTLLLPDDVDREKISATCEHGVLKVVLPKFTPQETKKEAKVIEIK
ncbi:MAG: Hsp20/alpha crystallin family protein [Muribaculaceae bacterium]|nr:Hsp20/alpha crystallin family protein [Muribaculaceae bacterium]